MEAKYFRPINHKRNMLAFHFVGSFATGYGGRELPPFERLFLGGENDLRGFDIRTVTPIAFIPVASATTVTYADPTRPGWFAAIHVARSVTIPSLTYQISFPGRRHLGRLQRRIPHSDRRAGQHVACSPTSARSACCEKTSCSSIPAACPT